MRGNPAVPAVALTFDCGSDDSALGPILDELKRNGLSATFFITGAFADRYPESARRIAAEGHDIANHTYSHKDLTDLGDAGIQAELRRAEEALRRTTGKDGKPWMRMPFGARNPRVLAAVAAAGYTSVYWTLDSGDWREGATAAGVRDAVLGRTGNGYIVVHHCAAQATARSLPEIIQGLRSKGMRQVTVSALLAQPRTETLNGDDLLVLVNKEQGLPADYVAGDLVDLGDLPATRSGLKVRREVLGALRRMLDGAKKEGLEVMVLSAFRSYQEQAAIYSGYVRSMGEARASRISAQPGKSQHQLGTTVDFTSSRVGYDLVEAFGDTPEGRWLWDNAHAYGFVMSYPGGKEHITGYAYEPWHYRYVGVEAATRVRNLGITLEEFLSARAAGGG